MPKKRTVLVILLHMLVIHGFQAEPMTCQTCAYMDIPKNPNFVPPKFFGSFTVNKSCGISNWTLVKELGNECPQNYICAHLYVYAKNSKSVRLVVRTCLSAKVNDLYYNRCLNIIKEDDKESASKFFGKLCEKTQVNSVNLCTCLTVNCHRSFAEHRDNKEIQTVSYAETIDTIFEQFNSTSKVNLAPNGCIRTSQRQSRINKSLYSNATSDVTSTNLSKVQVNTPKKAVLSEIPWFVWFFIPVGTLVAVGVALMSVHIQRRRSKRGQIVEVELNQFYRDEFLDSVSTSSEETFNGKFNKQFVEIPGSAFKIEKSKLLSCDEYEKTCRGVLFRDRTNIEIAVKMPKSRYLPYTTLYSVRRIFQEIKVLSFVGSHENIVRFYGSNTEGIKSGRVCVLLELCSVGTLQKYLRKNRENASLNKLILHNWSKQICQGMEYLASKKIAHADLCTRNVLLDSKKIAKISSFSLARSTLKNSECGTQKLQPVNWRWMAPDAIKNWEFTEKTDVWSFGVALWELYTLGDQPFPDLAWRSNFATQIERGLRLGKPRYIQKEMYVLMEQCWNVNPECRPTFFEIRETLQRHNVA